MVTPAMTHRVALTAFFSPKDGRRQIGASSSSSLCKSLSVAKPLLTLRIKMDIIVGAPGVLKVLPLVRFPSFHSLTAVS